MTTQARTPSPWTKLPISLRAILSGIVIALAAANVWPLLLLNVGVPLATISEAIFLTLYIWWAGGGGPPRTTQAARTKAFRRGKLSPTQWSWGVIAALFFAVTIHASVVLLFRFVPFPMAAFRHGYNFSFIPSLRLKWIAVVASATSAGICEETGFRGYMQRPIEQRHGAPFAILISSLFFMALHLTKDWATLGMVPIVFGAGVLLGLLAWSSGSLIPGMLGHVLLLATGGSGTANYIPLWIDSMNLGDSLFYQSGNNIGLGTTAPSNPMDIVMDSPAASSGLSLATYSNAAGTRPQVFFRRSRGTFASPLVL